MLRKLDFKKGNGLIPVVVQDFEQNKMAQEASAYIEGLDPDSDEGKAVKTYRKLNEEINILEITTLRTWKIIDRFSDYVAHPEPRSQKILPLLFSDGDKTFRAHTIDIGSKGLFIVTEHLLAQGQEFLIKMQFPGIPDPVQAKCEVLWIRKRDSGQPDKLPGMGVKFNKISKKDYKILREFLAIK